MNGVNIEQVKQYNKAIETYRAKSAQLKAEIDVNTREIQRLCSELTKDLGTEVTPENIKQIYEEQVRAINNNLEVGMGILERIKEEEKVANEDRQTAVQMKVGNMAAPQGVPQGMPQAPTMQPPMQTAAPIPPMFGGGFASFGAQKFDQGKMSAAAKEEDEGEFGKLGSIPPIFNNI